MMGYCGLDCAECPAYTATVANDAGKIAEVAAEWSQMFSADIKSEHVWCEGCKGDGRKSAYCESMCEVKKCATGKTLSDCGHCDDMEGCATIGEIFKNASCAETRIKDIAATRKMQ